MLRGIFIYLVAATVVINVSGQCVNPKPTCRLHRSSHTNRKFGQRLFNSIAKNTESTKNIFISPLNIGMALTMLLPGATGRTREEIITGLKWQFTLEKFDKIDLPCLYEFYNEATDSLGAANVTLRTAGRIYADNMLPLNPGPLVELQKYGAPLQKVDFSGAPQEARNAINTWVENKTEGFIPDLLGESDITSDTVMAITTAIYFKGEWEEKFNIVDGGGVFFVSDENAVEVPFLEQKGSFRYLEKNENIYFDIPYKSNTFGNCLDVSMVLVMHSTNIALQRLNKHLIDRDVIATVRALRKESAWPAKLRIPKFKISTEYQLQDPLMSLGMRQMFSRQNSGLMNFIREEDRDSIPNLFVKKVVHKAFVEVDEEGTTAAAATGIVISQRSLMITPQYTYDRPFFFIIYDHARESILFIGRMSDPST